MPSYDGASYRPPAPVASVTVRDPNSLAVVSGVMLLVDSGADITFIPRAAIAHLGVSAETSAKVEVASFDGSRSFADAVNVDVLLGIHYFRGRYLVCNDAHGILGRDILNHVKLVLDGPILEWSLQEP